MHHPTPPAVSPFEAAYQSLLSAARASDKDTPATVLPMALSKATAEAVKLLREAQNLNKPQV